ncbi:MAG: hypothetical protein KKA05_04625 [Alphaproteobacteria bacterium]|nr:hypothetical protein [Alphaproteobacteria bacterium]
MQAANDNVPGRAQPVRLKLEFSRAADYQRIDHLFSPAEKSTIDPDGYVVKRVDKYFRHAILSGGAAMLSDQNGRIMTLTIAYRTNHIDHAANNNNKSDGHMHDVTEFGSSMARLPGYNSAKLIVAALTLREWWHHPPRDAMIAEIKRDNIPSRKTYIDGLSWKELLDVAHTRRLYDATDPTLVNDADKGTSKNLTDLSHAKSLWHIADGDTIRHSAQVLLDFMAQGGLVNKATNHAIPVDFRALEQAGLTRARLTAIANGQLDRQTLRNIGTMRPPAP